jgi:shikimate kinase
MGNIYLTGFMGTGKSSVGTVLAKKLGYRFVDLDELIVLETGSSIEDLFARCGEPGFRALETEMVKRFGMQQGMVISTGGGAVMAPENRKFMHSAGVIINLTASPESIQRRLAAETGRPLLKDDKSPEKIGAMMAERERFYADADIRIDTEDKKVEDIAQEILLWLKRKPDVV